MTYTTGEMVLPKNAVVMDQEEMRYVEGGADWKTVVKWILVAAGVCLVLSSLFGFASIGCAVLAGKKVATIAYLCKAAGLCIGTTTILAALKKF